MGSDSQAEQQERMRQQQERKNLMLSQILDQQARARLNTIAVTKPEKAQMLESMIINMAQQNRGMQGKINDEQLKQLLEQVSEKMQKKTTVKFDRRRAAMDSDSD